MVQVPTSDQYFLPRLSQENPLLSGSPPRTQQPVQTRGVSSKVLSCRIVEDAEFSGCTAEQQPPLAAGAALAQDLQDSARSRIPESARSTTTARRARASEPLGFGSLSSASTSDGGMRCSVAVSSTSSASTLSSSLDVGGVQWACVGAAASEAPRPSAPVAAAVPFDFGAAAGFDARIAASARAEGVACQRAAHAASCGASSASGSECVKGGWQGGSGLGASPTPAGGGISSRRMFQQFLFTPPAEQHHACPDIGPRREFSHLGDEFMALAPSLSAGMPQDQEEVSTHAGTRSVSPVARRSSRRPSLGSSPFAGMNCTPRMSALSSTAVTAMVPQCIPDAAHSNPSSDRNTTYASAVCATLTCHAGGAGPFVGSSAAERSLSASLSARSVIGCRGGPRRARSLPRFGAQAGQKQQQQLPKQGQVPVRPWPRSISAASLSEAAAACFPADHHIVREDFGQELLNQDNDQQLLVSAAAIRKQLCQRSGSSPARPWSYGAGNAGCIATQRHTAVSPRTRSRSGSRSPSRSARLRALSRSREASVTRTRSKSAELRRSWQVTGANSVASMALQPPSGAHHHRDSLGDAVGPARIGTTPSPRRRRRSAAGLLQSGVDAGGMRLPAGGLVEGMMWPGVGTMGALADLATGLPAAVRLGPPQVPQPAVSAAAVIEPEVCEEPRDAQVDVFLRIRPADPREYGEMQCIRSKENWVCVDDASSANNGHWFEFEGVVDSCSSSSAGQEEVFHCVGKQAVTTVLEGFNTCVFSMGHTGTGKTYTLIGTPEAPGLLPSILAQLFEQRRSVRLSCLELYMDRFRDLLADDVNSTERPAPEVRCIPQRGVYVSNLSEVSVEDPQSAIRLANMASRNRLVSKTNMNAASSRGHAVFQLTLETGARLCIVDLAGRENEKTTRNHGQTLAELGYINRSLFHLTHVIQALARGPKRCINGSPRNIAPFRNSKLTLLLSECLQSTRTTLVATVSPASSSFEETLTTLRLAQAVRQISTRSCRRSARTRPPRPDQEDDNIASRLSTPASARAAAIAAGPPHQSSHSAARRGATTTSRAEAYGSPSAVAAASTRQSGPGGSAAGVGCNFRDKEALSARAARALLPGLSATAPNRRGDEQVPQADFTSHQSGGGGGALRAEVPPHRSPFLASVGRAPEPSGVPIPFAKAWCDSSISSRSDVGSEVARPSRLAAWKSSGASCSSHSTAASQSKAVSVPCTEAADSDRERWSVLEEPENTDDVLDDEIIFQIIEAPRMPAQAIV